MSHETFALINALGQVVNHIVMDKDNENFESNMADQLAFWDCTRYVETTEEPPVIILDESPDIWTTHCDNPDCENHGFNLPDQAQPVFAPQAHAPIIRKKSELPADSWLLEENASDRPDGWVFPSHVTVIEG
jgi:hypothetical protein